jgi:cytoskeletal protein RodZ
MIGKTIVLNQVFPIKFKLTVPLKLLAVFTFVLMVALLISCVFQLNKYTAGYFTLQDYQQKLDRLTEENRGLEVQFSSSDSLNRVFSYAGGDGFEKVDQVDYIQLLDGTALAK